MTKIAIIGAGHMGSAIIQGLTSPENKILVENPINPRVDKLAIKFNFQLVHSIPEVIKQKPDFVFLTTPAPVTLKIAEELNKIDDKTVIISAAAGISYEDLKRKLPNNPVIRIIPNIPVAINAGTIGLFMPDFEKEIQDKILQLLNQLGDIIPVQEDQLSIVGTIGGCGPAFVDIFLDALGDSGVLNGLSRDLSNKLAASMVKGSASLA